MNKPMSRERASSWSWILQALTGALLVVLLGLHMVVQHFVVAGGLRNFDRSYNICLTRLYSYWKSLS